MSSRKRAFCSSIFLAFVFHAGTAGALEGLEVGMKAPLIKLRNLQGKETALTEQRDANAAVVVFWATWSDHSAAVLERLEGLYRKYKKEKLHVLAVNVDKQQLEPRELAEIKKMTSRIGITFPVLVDEGLKSFREYGVVAVPSTVVIDKEGTIRGEMAAYPLAVREDLFDLIEALAEARPIKKRPQASGYQPVPRAVRYYNLARAMAGRGMLDVEVVDDNLKKSIATDANFVLPLLLLARLYRERAETEEAIEYRGSAVVTATFKPERERYLKEAALLMEKAMKLAPQNPPVLTEAALIFMSQGKREAARERLAEAISRDSSYTPAQFFLSALLVREGKIKQGEEEFQKAVRLNPLEYQAYFAMARAYEEKGMEKKAAEAYKKVYEVLYQERELFPYSYGR